MKQIIKMFVIVILHLIYNKVAAQLVIQHCFTKGAVALDTLKLQYSPSKNLPERRLNLYVISREKNWDILRFSIRVRSRVRSWFKEKKLYVIIAKDTKQAVHLTEKRLQKKRIDKIGNIWFDSHGHYAYRYSSFSIGRDEYSYKNINDSSRTEQLRKLSMYCDSNTEIGVGSCYGGATFTFPGTKKLMAQPMHGDSLITGLGRIFKSSNIYGCESWVMAKPGIFSNKFAFAGSPLNRRFRDSAFKPVWERLGEWNRYNQSTGIFEQVNTVALNRNGEIFTRSRDYLSLNKAQKIVSHNLQKLQAGLYKKFDKQIEN